GAWGFAHEAFVIADSLGIGGLDVEKIEKTKQSVLAMQEAPAWLLVFSLAATPAIIEELCFRGFLFTAFRNVLTPGRLVVFTAIVFGLFHVVTGNVLLVERFVPTTLLGLILGWIALRSGSVWPGIVMHFTHNALLNLAIKYQDRLGFLGSGSDDRYHLPATWLAVLSTLTLVGMAAVFLATRKPHSGGTAEFISDASPETPGDIAAAAGNETASSES
ncbi:MAG: CPBP family intramembrane glutamic endopeptidase, partial [Planctomycetota bacterium]